MDTDFFKTELLARKKALQDAIAQAKDAAQPVQLDQAMVGRLSRMDAIQQQEMTLAAQRRREQDIKRIDSALARIESGDYGFCYQCDEEIAAARLKLDPAITTCINCAQ